MKQELVLRDAGVNQVLIICHHGGDLCRWREGMLFTFKDPFNDL